MPFQGEDLTKVPLVVEHISTELNRAEKRVADRVLEIARRLAPVRDGTQEDRRRAPGTFRDSLYPSVVQGRTGGKFAHGFDVSVMSDDPVAKWFRYGTKAHDIPLGKPFAKGHLKYETKDGELHFSRQVHHPGTDPHPFMDSADTEITNYLDEIMGRILDDI